MADLTEGEVSGAGEGGRPLVKLAALVALVAGGILLATATPVGDWLSRDGIGRGVAWLRGSTWAPVIFVAVYAGATALAIPGSILTLAGGALFGVFWGTIYNTIAANLGANMAFGVARWLGRDGVRALAGDRLDALDRATRDYGFRGLLTLRLIPAVPFNALNFGMGLTAISWGAYAVATLVGIFPGTLVYTMFADALLAGSQEASREALVRVLVSGALLVALSFLPTLARKLGVRVPGREGDDDAVNTSRALILLAAASLAVPASLAAQAGPGELPDHDAFTGILQEVVETPRVDYAELVERRSALDAYLEELEATPPAALEAAPDDARLAFWINAYNACMLKLVADHYPIEKQGGLFDRIRNAVADRPDNSVWQIDDVFTREHCPVAGELRSQDEIEHEIIRPVFQDPRIHFVVNCAARSCPSLGAEAYRAATLDAQLDAAVAAFVADQRHFQVVDGDPPTIRLNKVLDWYREDFGGVEGLREFFQPYVDDEVASLLQDSGTEIEFMEYDWTLNDTSS